MDIEKDNKESAAPAEPVATKEENPVHTLLLGRNKSTQKSRTL